MAKEKEVQSIRDYGNRIKKYRRRRATFIFLLLLVIVAVGAIYLYRMYNKTFKNCETINKAANKKDDAAGYLEYDGAVVRYSKNGAEAIKKNGEILWNGSYEMLDPIADTCGKYVVVADRGSKSVHIFNEKGEAGSFNMQYDIVKVKIASQGVVAVLMEDGEKIYIRLYDVNGEMLTDNDMNLSIDGYPIDIAISEDGQKLGMIFLTVNEGKLINKVAFYNFGKVGESLENHFAGGFKYDKVENIMPSIEFLGNDVACAYKDNGFILYSIPELPEVITDQTVEGKIKSVIHNKNYTGLVMEGTDSSSSRLILYNLKGKKVLERKLDLQYKEIYMSGDEIILYDDINCEIIKTDGKIKFKHTFNTNISVIYPTGQMDLYFMVGEEEIEEIKLLE